MMNDQFFMGRLLTCMLVFAALSCSSEAVKKKGQTKIIMAILAHPDDETAFGQILAKYAAEGKKVYLVIAADGRYGVEKHTGIPAGDSLAAVRRKESICAAEILGIEPPVFLGLHDMFGLMTGLGQYFKQTKEVKEKLVGIISDVNPDLIITFGPDGDTGHMDHKGIGDLVTEVILREGWVDRYPLFYLTWPKEKLVAIPQGGLSSLNYVDKAYRNIRIKYSAEDREKLFKSLNCYKSQLTERDVRGWIDAELKDSSFTTYFRQLIVDTTVRTGFLE